MSLFDLSMSPIPLNDRQTPPPPQRDRHPADEDEDEDERERETGERGVGGLSAYSRNTDTGLYPKVGAPQQARYMACMTPCAAEQSQPHALNSGAIE